MEEWGRWFEDPAARILKQEDVGAFWVSTVFLGIDHNFFGRGQPILWETMIFADDEGFSMDRYESRDDALAGHTRAVMRAQDLIEKAEPTLDALRALLARPR